MCGRGRDKFVAKSGVEQANLERIFFVLRGRQ